jgi:hypothetical protein
VRVVNRAFHCSSVMGRYHHGQEGTWKILYNAKIFKVGTSVHVMNVLVELHIAMTYQPSLSVFPLDGHGKNSSATTRGYWLCNDNSCFYCQLSIFSE